ncbi:hypothetical protein O181_009160 [Austropuccinia psidii MF-1]|uniref:Integrase catalytic domain-containing protein n=1 Tax=Austropuccinia psidii MF-1 TaxID=1389203 RepID=A0A9Q3BQS0_9BASI|nr:hypothetical protein [Austropuccinia psidii MF-1]
MTVPSNDMYLRIYKDRKSKNAYGGQCGKRIIQNTATPVKDVKRKINALEKRLKNIIKIQEPRRAFEIIRMDWVTGFPQGGDKNYNSCLVISDRFGKTLIFLPYPKDDTNMDTALLIWNRVVSGNGMLTNIIIDRDIKLK